MLRSLTRWGLVRRRAESELIETQMSNLSVKAASPRIAAATLSGGNQQKLVLGKWLARNPKVLILDEPTRGIDVGAKSQVHQLIRNLAAKGLATLVISSDLPELLSLCDRLLVVRSGRIVGELQGATATQEAVLALGAAGRCGIATAGGSSDEQLANTDRSSVISRHGTFLNRCLSQTGSTT